MMILLTGGTGIIKIVEEYPAACRGDEFVLQKAGRFCRKRHGRLGEPSLPKMPRGLPRGSFTESYVAKALLKEGCQKTIPARWVQPGVLFTQYGYPVLNDEMRASRFIPRRLHN